ncbi:MAG: putative hydroxymethylpyrimidine transport system substrate-binding protein [Thermoleophilaceae bacterium]|nr:putative hydroxymethylpyrimidine transport system substrate-binding protein [Thermoleophilaceae bacterium]MEA2437398.1 putative hydroxymethylpyrimidine transport system substrate-binding protein [Thermoleophilaceae bacterium]
MTARRTLVACVLAALAILPGCGERKETLTPKTSQTLRVVLSPLNSGENAYFASQREGYFNDAGLKVQARVVTDAATAIRDVQQGKADLAIGTEPDLLEARGRGARVVSVAAIVQRPFTSLIAPKLSLATVAALATKPIGTSGLDYQRAFADAIFKKAGGRARVVDVGLDPIAALPKKKVAAVIAQAGGQALPGGAVAVPVDRLGVPTFSEFVLVANQDAVTRDSDAIRSFIGAMARGTRSLASANSMGSSIKMKGPEVARIRALMLPPTGKPYGWQDAVQWRRFAAWMRANKLPQKGATGAFTNSLLPGQGS